MGAAATAEDIALPRNPEWEMSLFVGGGEEPGKVAKRCQASAGNRTVANATTHDEKGLHHAVTGELRQGKEEPEERAPKTPIGGGGGGEVKTRNQS